MKKFAEFISTGLYIGYFPVAPGTFGSLTAVILIWCVDQLTGYSLFMRVIFVAVSFIGGLMSVDIFLKDVKQKDPGYVVIDEWAGQFVALMLFPATITNLIIGFILFRVFDVLKVYPANRAENLRGAWGVMVDDIIAGLYALLCLYLWQKIKI